jgi:hypothetical protein
MEGMQSRMVEQESPMLSMAQVLLTHQSPAAQQVPLVSWQDEAAPLAKSPEQASPFEAQDSVALQVVDAIAMVPARELWGYRGAERATEAKHMKRTTRRNFILCECDVLFL